MEAFAFEYVLTRVRCLQLIFTIKIGAIEY